MKANESKKILLLEDDWILKHTLNKVLSQKGFSCSIPKNTEEAFSLLNTSNIRLIVADLNIGWINTLDLCQMIKRSKQFQPIPFIVISGSTDETDIKKAFLNGCDDYLPKPFHISELVSAIETLLEVNGYHHLI